MADMTGAAPRAIVALDVPSAADALALLQRLGPACDFVKIGNELFTAEGPAVVERTRASGRDVFLDLKFHDIPTTVRGGARNAAALGARLITAHASGGRRMLEAAVDGAGDSCGVLAVTVLTSLDAAELGDAWHREIASIGDEVLRLAGVARASGAHGVVCGGREAASVRARFGDELAVLVPGVRLAGAPSNDQARIVTPREAVESGASYIVLGRTVTAAPDPRAALALAREEMSETSRGRLHGPGSEHR
ncbi:MAG: orotidine-5'-phosphate decarboxylase [Gemmatimonadaceae bacterium]